ncbi:hypothetical protein PAHAL_5G474300 [Panicum hallii]|uniref:Uncharacterized protein n=1 Tax=Panicum hallii TaxID=206008 RepID=A0A2T8INR1_9POAL|nr:hypothetical protein PAHAL_5G474300 [Panicum hallii]
MAPTAFAGHTGGIGERGEQAELCSCSGNNCHPYCPPTSSDPNCRINPGSCWPAAARLGSNPTPRPA